MPNRGPAVSVRAAERLEARKKFQTGDIVGFKQDETKDTFHVEGFIEGGLVKLKGMALYVDPTALRLVYR